MNDERSWACGTHPRRRRCRKQTLASCRCMPTIVREEEAAAVAAGAVPKPPGRAPKAYPLWDAQGGVWTNAGGDTQPSKKRALDPVDISARESSVSVATTSAPTMAAASAATAPASVPPGPVTTAQQQVDDPRAFNLAASTSRSRHPQILAQSMGSKARSHAWTARGRRRATRLVCSPRDRGFCGRCLEDNVHRRRRA